MKISTPWRDLATNDKCWHPNRLNAIKDLIFGHIFMTTPAIRRLNDWHLGVPQCYLPGEPQSRELACQQKRWLQDYLNWTVLLYAAPIGKTQFISVKFSLFPLLFQVHIQKSFFFLQLQASLFKVTKGTQARLHLYGCIQCMQYNSIKVQIVQLFIDILHVWATLTNQSSFTPKHQHLR